MSTVMPRILLGTLTDQSPGLAGTLLDLARPQNEWKRFLAKFTDKGYYEQEEQEEDHDPIYDKYTKEIYYAIRDYT